MSSLIHASQKLVINFAASLGGSSTPLAEYFQGANTSYQNRIKQMSLDYCTFPNSWSIIHPNFDNTQYELTVWVLGVPHIIRGSVNPTGVDVISTPQQLAAAVQASLNVATASLGVAWTVTYVAATGCMETTITSGGGSVFHWNSSVEPTFLKVNRFLFATGYYRLSVPVKTVSDAQLSKAVASLTSYIVDLQPVKTVFIMIDGSSHGAVSDSTNAHGSFVVPVRANYGFNSTYNAGIDFENTVYFHDMSIASKNLKIRLTDRSGQLIPFTGGEVEMIIDIESRDLKRPRPYDAVYHGSPYLD